MERSERHCRADSDFPTDLVDRELPDIGAAVPILDEKLSVPGNTMSLASSVASALALALVTVTRGGAAAQQIVGRRPPVEGVGIGGPAAHSAGW